MKKVVMLSLIILLSAVVSAQGIYTKVTKYDKFDDVEWEKNIKTLITKTDNGITIETKGGKPVEYAYTDIYPLAEHDGYRDSIVNIVADVWGYESRYIVFTESDVEGFKNDIKNELGSEADSLSEEKLKMMVGLIVLKKIDKLPTITFRTISTSKYSFRYKTDMVWVKYDDGSRIIYSKD